MILQCENLDSITKAASNCILFDIHQYGITGNQTSIICISIAAYFFTCWILNKLQHSVK